MIREYVVKLTVPEGAKDNDIRAYILEAVQTWRGQLRPPGIVDDQDPGDVMWHLDPEKITVRRKVSCG